MPVARITRTALAADNARLSTENHRMRLALHALATGETPDYSEEWTIDADRYSLRTFGVTRADGGIVVLVASLAGNKRAQIDVHGDIDVLTREVHERRGYSPLSDREIRALDDACWRARASARTSRERAWGPCSAA